MEFLTHKQNSQVLKIVVILEYSMGIVVRVTWRVWLDLTWNFPDSGHRVTWLKITALIGTTDKRILVIFVKFCNKKIKAQKRALRIVNNEGITEAIW